MIVHILPPKDTTMATVPYTASLVANPSELGALIARRRKELKLTQDDLATAAGTSRRFLHEVEHGKANARIGLVFQLCAELGIVLRADRA